MLEVTIKIIITKILLQVSLKELHTIIDITVE